MIDPDIVVLEDLSDPVPQHFLDDEALALRLSLEQTQQSSFESDAALARRLADMEDHEADVVAVETPASQVPPFPKDTDLDLAKALDESLRDTQMSGASSNGKPIIAFGASSSSQSLPDPFVLNSTDSSSAPACPPELENNVNTLFAQFLRGEEVKFEPARVSKNYKLHAVHALLQEFPCAPLQTVQDAFEEFGSYLEAWESLEKSPDKNKLKKRRPKAKAPPCPFPKNLTKEMKSRSKGGLKSVTICAAFRQRKQKFEAHKEQLRTIGGLSTCGCCFDDEVPPEAELRCNAAEGHSFCIPCVKKQGLEFFGSKLFTLNLLDRPSSSSSAHSTNEPFSSSGPSNLACTMLPCMQMASGCKGFFSDGALRRALPEKEYVRYSRRSAALQAASSGLEDLVGCPACDFMVVMSDPNNNIIRCLNTECGRVSCRWCLEKDHAPLRCDEVEKDGEVRIRTFLEEHMAETMMRRCPNPKCGKPCEKTEGCNHIKCPCGTHICYLCGEKINGSRPYDHYKDGSEGGGKNNVSSKCTVYGVPTWAKQAEKAATKQAEKALEDYLKEHPELQEVMQQRKDVLKRTLAHVTEPDRKRPKK